MGGLADELRAEVPNKGGKRSILDQLVEDLDEEDGAALLAALQDPAVSQAVIANVLTRRGFKCSPDLIGKWRRNRGII